MRLPIQSQPVLRNIPSQPFAYGGASGASDGERGVLPSGYGVQPNGWFESLMDVVKTVGQIAPIVASIV